MNRKSEALFCSTERILEHALETLYNHVKQGHCCTKSVDNTLFELEKKYVFSKDGSQILFKNYSAVIKKQLINDNAYCLMNHPKF